MSVLHVIDERSGQRIDTVTLTSGGELVYETGAGRDLVGGKLAAARVRGGRSLPAPELTAQVFGLLRGGWSNGYTATVAA